MPLIIVYLFPFNYRLFIERNIDKKKLLTPSIMHNANTSKSRQSLIRHGWNIYVRPTRTFLQRDYASHVYNIMWTMIKKCGRNMGDYEISSAGIVCFVQSLGICLNGYVLYVGILYYIICRRQNSVQCNSSESWKSWSVIVLGKWPLETLPFRNLWTVLIHQTVDERISVEYSSHKSASEVDK